MVRIYSLPGLWTNLGFICKLLQSQTCHQIQNLSISTLHHILGCLCRCVTILISIENVSTLTSKQIFLTHLLFSSPRLCFSEPQKKAILNWAQEMHAPNVPTMYAVDQSQKRVLDLLGNPLEKVNTGSGNIFYLNRIGDAIAKVTISFFLLFRPDCCVSGLCQPSDPLHHARLSANDRLGYVGSFPCLQDEPGCAIIARISNNPGSGHDILYR